MKKYTDYNNYFKVACVNHKSLLHNDTTNKRFYPVDIEDVLNGLKISCKEAFMILENPEFKPFDAGSDNFRKIIRGAFVILKEAKIGDNSDRERILDECQVIAEDITSKMINDTKKGNLDKTYPFRIELDLNKVNFNKVGPLMTNMFGWRVEFALNESFNLAFDESKWNNETKFSI
jgi:hypothetical protein